MSSSNEPPNRTTEAPSLKDVPTLHQQIAIRWLMWDIGATEEEAKEALDKWPDQGRATYAIEVAKFIVEECHGR